MLRRIIRAKNVGKPGITRGDLMVLAALLTGTAWRSGRRPATRLSPAEVLRTE
jgi:hypothetical protein